MKAKTVKVELRPGWPMHVGVITDESGFIVWKAPVARTSELDALADAEEYFGERSSSPDDTSQIDQQLDELDKLIKARRAEVTKSMAAEECNCSRCESGREYIRRELFA